MGNHKFQYQEHIIEYTKFGEGDEIMFAFHGFGRNNSDWIQFEDSFGKKYTIYSFNLFFHGGSFYNKDIDKSPIEKFEIVELFSLFCNKHQINKYSLLAYSVGGKIALNLIELIGERINKVFLFAPDGIKYNMLYEIGSKTKIGNFICNSIVKNPTLLFFVANTLHKIKIIDNKLLRFVNIHMETREQRQMVFDTWKVYRKLTPNLSIVKHNINFFGIKTYLFVGKYDKIITPHIIRSLSRGIKKELYNYTVLKDGHNLINQKTNTFLLENFSNEI